MKHPHQPLVDHKSSPPRTDYSLQTDYPPRTDNKYITYEACSLTQHELHRLLYHTHTKDPKEYCLRGPSFEDVCERINQYNLKHKTHKKVSYDTSLSKRPPKNDVTPTPPLKHTSPLSRISLKAIIIMN